jgi:hypothetical protein
MKKLFLVFFSLVFFLSGCVRYDVALDFSHQHQGAIVQHIKLGQQLTSFSQLEGNEWLNSIERRASKLQGKTKRISGEEIVVTIPFVNTEDLVDKFNNFFNSIVPKAGTNESKSDAIDLLKLNSTIAVKQSNFLLAERNVLDLTVDLRSLGVMSQGGQLIVSPGSLVDLEFVVNTPWGATSLVDEEMIAPEVHNEGKQLVWQLQAGEINHLKTVFWLPSFLGIGALAILLIFVVGFYLKYRTFPGYKSSPL